MSAIQEHINKLRAIYEELHRKAEEQSRNKIGSREERIRTWEEVKIARAVYKRAVKRSKKNLFNASNHLLATNAAGNAKCPACAKIQSEVQQGVGKITLATVNNVQIPQQNQQQQQQQQQQQHITQTVTTIPHESEQQPAQTCKEITNVVSAGLNTLSSTIATNNSNEIQHNQLSNQRATTSLSLDIGNQSKQQSAEPLQSGKEFIDLLSPSFKSIVATSSDNQTQHLQYTETESTPLYYILTKQSQQQPTDPIRKNSLKIQQQKTKNSIKRNIIGQAKRQETVSMSLVNYNFDGIYFSNRMANDITKDSASTANNDSMPPTLNDTDGKLFNELKKPLEKSNTKEQPSQVEQVQDSLDHLRKELRELTVIAKEQQESRRDAEQQQQPNSQQIQPQLEINDTAAENVSFSTNTDQRDDHSAINNTSNCTVIDERIFRFLPDNPVTRRYKSMAAGNKSANGEFKSVADLLQPVAPAKRSDSATECKPVYIQLKFNIYAYQIRFRILKLISEKATGRHPYKIRSVYGGIYELAYDSKDAAECRRKFEENGITVVDPADIDLFSTSPSNPDQTITEISEIVAKSMGFALGRAFHPAVAKMYQAILTNAGHADVYKQVEMYCNKTRNESMSAHDQIENQY